MNSYKPKAVLAFDLGGTNLRAAAVSSTEGQIIYRAARKTPRGNQPSEIVQTIVEAVSECMENCSEFEFEAIGAAAPGAIVYEQGTITKSPNLPALDGFRLAAAIERELDLKAVLENDANAAALGESWMGASRGSRHSVCITLGTGVGGGIIVEKRLLRGAIGSAGEIGHVTVEPKGAPCGCGSRGCLEQYVSASAIVRLAKETSDSFSNSTLSNQPDLTSGDVYQAGIAGDELALQVFRQMGMYLGIAFAGIVNLLNPEIIVVGGGASAGWNLFMPSATEELFRRAYRAPAENTKIVPSLLNDDAGLFGAAKLALDYGFQ